MESALVPYASSALSNLLGQQTTKAATQLVSNAAVPSLSKLVITQAPSVTQSIPVTKPQMQTIYRGISAKTDDDLAQYISDMTNKNIQPTTYGGGNMQGEGYNFATNKDVAKYFATRSPVKESRAILKTEVPIGRFIQQNEQNQNRLQDFVRRAEARGIPYENGESERQGLADMQRYFKKNGILGVKSHSGETYVINNNDDAWMNNLEVSDAMRGRNTRIEPDRNLLTRLSDTMDIQKEVNDEFDRLVPANLRARVKSYMPAKNLGDGLADIADKIDNYKIQNRPNAFGSIDFYDSSNFDYNALAKKGEKELEKTFGKDTLQNLRDNVSGTLKNFNKNYDADKAKTVSFLESPDSDKVVELSKQLLPPGSKVWRGGTKDDINYSISKAVAETYGNATPYILKDTDRYIAPQITSVFHDGIDPEYVVLLLKK